MGSQSGATEKIVNLWQTTSFNHHINSMNGFIFKYLTPHVCLIYLLWQSSLFFLFIMHLRVLSGVMTELVWLVSPGKFFGKPLTDLNKWIFWFTKDFILYMKSSNWCTPVQLVSVRSCLMALNRLTKDSSHTCCCHSQVVLTTCWLVYTSVISVHSKSSWSRGSLWLDSSEMSCSMSSCFLGTISSQITFKFLVLRSDASSASSTENSPLSLNCTPASRISRVKWRTGKEE